MLAVLLHWAGRGHCLCDVAVEGQRVRDAQNQQNHDSSSVSEKPEEGHVFEGWEQVVHDLRYSVSYNHTECHHAAESAARSQSRNSFDFGVQLTRAIARRIWQ